MILETYVMDQFINAVTWLRGLWEENNDLSVSTSYGDYNISLHFTPKGYIIAITNPDGNIDDYCSSQDLLWEWLHSPAYYSRFIFLL